MTENLHNTAELSQTSFRWTEGEGTALDAQVAQPVRGVKRVKRVKEPLGRPEANRSLATRGSAQTAKRRQDLAFLGGPVSAGRLGVALLRRYALTRTASACVPGSHYSGEPSSWCQDRQEFRSPFLFRPDFCVNVKGEGTPKGSLY